VRLVLASLGNKRYLLLGGGGGGGGTTHLARLSVYELKETYDYKASVDWFLHTVQ
jgi:hypothetical protein